MRIGVQIDTSKSIDVLTERVQDLATTGYDSVWASQIFGYDALTLLALIGRDVPGIELGTGVVPVHPRHPQVLAQQALTVQAAIDGRLALGIGLSHQMLVEGMWGYPFDHPAEYMRQYLTALVPMLAGETVAVHGDAVTAVIPAPLDIPGSSPPPVLVAALGPVMLRIAGELSAGTVTWMTGVKTVESHIVPRIAAAAAAAGRPVPRVVVGLPITVTGDEAAARERIDRAFAIYPTLPSYKAMLDLEGAERPSDAGLVGDERQVAAVLRRLAGAGVTDFVASVVGNADERARTNDLLMAEKGAA